MPRANLELIRRELFFSPRTNVYAVLDGASIEDLLPALAQHEPPHVCLYRGEIAPDLAPMAPYLVQVNMGSPFLEWLIRDGWGGHWGIYAVSGADLRSMRQHFRTLLLVRMPDGRKVYFRFYDPRVLRDYLPTCNDEERAMVHGPVVRYVMEAESVDTLLWFGPDSAAVREVGVDAMV